MLIDNNVEDFFHDEVAVDGIYTPDGGQPSNVRLILNRTPSNINEFGLSVESSMIEAVVKESDFGDSKQGETLVINSVTYYIIDPQPSIGMMTLELSKDAP